MIAKPIVQPTSQPPQKRTPICWSLISLPPAKPGVRLQTAAVAALPPSLRGCDRWSSGSIISILSHNKTVDRFQTCESQTAYQPRFQLGAANTVQASAISGAEFSETHRAEMAARPCDSGAPQKSLEEHVAIQAEFLQEKLTPELVAAQAGEGHVFFVDAAHFVYGTYLCCLWSFVRQYVRAASGRQRFNVLGAWNATTRKLVSVTNTTFAEICVPQVRNYQYERKASIIVMN